MLDDAKTHPKWLYGWLCSGLGAASGGILFLLATWMLWRRGGWQPVAADTSAEIALFLRMIIGGLLGASIAGMLAVRRPPDLSFAVAAGGSLSYVLALQILLMMLYVIHPDLCRGPAAGSVGRLEVTAIAGTAGALAPPLIAVLVVAVRPTSGTARDQTEDAL